VKVVNKPWGREEWIELNDRYCYKRLYIDQGHRTSFQYHIKKLETIYIIEGSAEVWLENNEGEIEKKIMVEGDYFTNLPMRKHRVVALSNLILQEVSTPEVDDVIRIEDDNQRPDGRISEEHN
jgi:mannose-6-phosphate isomerase-like protein (cupin superfamily)